MKSLLTIGLVLVSAALLSAYSLPDAGLRIISGRDAEPHEFPYIVSLTLHTPDGEVHHNCGGSILNERWILTAAHCCGDMEGAFYEIRAGAHYLNETMKGEQTSLVSRAIVHPGFTGQFGSNDIALVELETPLTFSETVRPIALPPQDEIPLVASAVASGWGADSFKIIDDEKIVTFPNTLQTTEVPVLTNEQCRAEIDPPKFITDFEFCTFGIEQGICFADSGGPLVQDNKVIGVISRGWGVCNDFPSVYQRVSYYIDWISSYIN